MKCALAVAFVLFFAGCASDDPDDVPLRHRFTARPLRLLVAGDAPVDCIDSLRASALWYRDRRTTLTLDMVDAANPALNGFVVGGAVGVIFGKLNENVRGSTRIALTAGDDIYAAEITLAFCDAKSVAHECGHALGLEHLHKRGNLMYPAVDHVDWTLTDMQEAWIEDETLGTIVSYASTEPQRWDSMDNVRVIECFGAE